MSPDALWPNLPGYATSFTDAEHAAHRTAKGIHYPENLAPGTDSRKAAKGLMKLASKPHLKFSRKRTQMSLRTAKKKKKER